jgi:hypothetical protein
VLADGFYALEYDVTGSWRWTNGDAKLRFPPAAEMRVLALFVRALMPSWEAPREPARLAA